MLVFCAAVPHPPLLVPDVGGGEEKKIADTAKAMRRLSVELQAAEPDTIIFITPHTLIYSDRFNICNINHAQGDFANFGGSKFSWRGDVDTELALRLARKSEQNGISSLLYANGKNEVEIDHGTLVPLYFFCQELADYFKILPIGYSYLSRAEHYVFGQSIGEVIDKIPQRVAVVASGDLSHRLDYPAPAGFLYEGKRFDSEFVQNIRQGDEKAIIEMDEDFVDNAGECGYRSMLILLGVLSGKEFEPEVYSYEGPFGVGYMVANFYLDNI